MLKLSRLPGARRAAETAGTSTATAFTSASNGQAILAGPGTSGKGSVGVYGRGHDSGLPGFGGNRAGTGVTGMGGRGGSVPSVGVLSVLEGPLRPGGRRGTCRVLAPWRVLAVLAVVVMAIGGVCPGIAAAAPAGHLRAGAHPVPGAGLSLARAPAGLRAAVRRTLGLRAAPAASAFQQAKLTAADASPGDLFGGSVAIYGSTAVVGAPYKNSATGAAYVFVRSGTAWSQQAKLTAADASPGDLFGSSVAIYGSTVVVGARSENAAFGAVYVFVGSGTAWSQQAKLTAADGASGDYFGESVAISGSTVVVGAYGKKSFTGAVYVFVGSGSAWSQQAKLTAGDAAPSDYFGIEVAISGSTVVVGAAGKNSFTGAAYVFVHGLGWLQQAKLTAADAAPGDDFGFSVAIYGATAVVGAPDKKSHAGAAYVFARSGPAWTQQAELTAADAVPGDYFGWSVAISVSTAVVGAPDKNAAYVFVRSGPAWSQQAKLTAADTAAGDAFGILVASSGSTVVVAADSKNSFTGAAYVFVVPSQQAKLAAADAVGGDQFGWSVAISGSTAVVGAPFKNSKAGAVYVFVQSGTAWTQQAKLTAADAAPGDDFGWSVAISGTTVVVGAPFKNSTAGAAYVFVGAGSHWVQQPELTAADAATGDDFGISVAVSAVSTVVVGASAKNSNTGAAYVFARLASIWYQQAKLTAADAAPGDQFGWSVAISGSTAVVGAYRKNSTTGAAYVFAQSGTGWPQQAKLAAADAAAGDGFGYSVAIFGNTAMVAAPFKNSRAGAAYVFARSGTAWTQQAKLTAADAAPGDLFGYSMAISGSTAVIGAAYKNSHTGAAYVFAPSGTAWTQQAKLTAADAAPGDYFTSSVAISGSTAIAGAPNKNSNTGAAYVYAAV